MRRSLWLALAAPLAFCACGAQDAAESSDDAATGGDATGAASATPAGPTEYTGDVMVLEDAGHGPRICFGAVALSYPPQCGEVDVVGWSWDEVGDFESAAESKWGDFLVTGYFDEAFATFTLTQPPTSATETTTPPSDDRWTTGTITSCEPPAGGWAVVDATKTTEASMMAALEHAQREPDHAGGWIDQSPFDVTPKNEHERMNHPEYLVLNVRFTGDLARHEADLREIWGGALCVDRAEHSDRELAAINAQLDADPRVIYSMTDVPANALDVQVFVDDGLQAQLDEQYGEGVVRVSATMQPVSP